MVTRVRGSYMKKVGPGTADVQEETPPVVEEEAEETPNTAVAKVSTQELSELKKPAVPTKTRTVTTPSEKLAPRKISWKKIGRGTFRIHDGRIIKQNQVFQAALEEIPESFRDVIVPLNPEAQAKLETPVPVKSVTRFEIVPAEEGDGLFNVINSVSKKCINAAALTDLKAKELLNNLS